MNFVQFFAQLAEASVIENPNSKPVTILKVVL
jgi:hypothetical protein